MGYSGFARSLRLISRSMASRMNSARRFGPAKSSIRSNVSLVRRTNVAFVTESLLSGGRPMRRDVADIGISVKATSKALSLIDCITDNGYDFNHRCDWSEKMLTKAAKTALVYLHITGDFPKGIQMATWGQLAQMSDRNGVRRLLKPEALALIERHPFKVAHDYLTARGFTYVPHARSTSHYVRYVNLNNGDGANAYRDGGVSIRTFADNPPFRTESISHEQIIVAMQEAA